MTATKQNSWHGIAPSIAAALGVGAIVNAIFMLAAPAAWYFAVPGVTTTGAFNQHFIRDIGLVYLFVGVSFVGGALMPAHRLVLWASGSIWLSGHALFHLWEVAAGICGPGKLLIDFPAVFVPPAIGFALCLRARNGQGTADVDQGCSLKNRDR